MIHRFALFALTSHFTFKVLSLGLSSPGNAARYFSAFIKIAFGSHRGWPWPVLISNVNSTAPDTVNVGADNARAESSRLVTYIITSSAMFLHNFLHCAAAQLMINCLSRSLGWWETWAQLFYIVFADGKCFNNLISFSLCCSTFRHNAGNCKSMVRRSMTDGWSGTRGSLTSSSFWHVQIAKHESNRSTLKGRLN